MSFIHAGYEEEAIPDRRKVEYSGGTNDELPSRVNILLQFVDVDAAWTLI